MSTLNISLFKILLIQQFGLKQVSVALQIPYHNLYYYYQKSTNCNFHSKKNGGNRNGLTLLQRKAIHHAVVFFINKKPTTTLKELQQFVIRVLGINRSVAWYSIFLASIDITWKTVELKEINKYTPLNLIRLVIMVDQSMYI